MLTYHHLITKHLALHPQLYTMDLKGLVECNVVFFREPEDVQEICDNENEERGVGEFLISYA